MLDLDILVPFVTRLTQQDNPPPPPNDLPPSRSDTTERELRSRLFWTTYVFSASLEAQSGRSLSARAPKGFTAQDCRLALPVSDDRFEMGACGEGLRSDGLTHPEGGASRMLISELGHVSSPSLYTPRLIGNPALTLSLSFLSLFPSSLGSSASSGTS